MNHGFLTRTPVTAGAALIGLAVLGFAVSGGSPLSAAFAGGIEGRYDCSYYRAGGGDLVTEHNCLIYPATPRDDASGDATVSKAVTSVAAYDKDGLAYLFSPAGLFYFTRTGTCRKTLPYDNGPDYFSEGLARFEHNGTIGFIDKSLSVVIESRYDFAYPFRNGLSVVCIGCVAKKSGEHTEMVGGKWGLINRKGEIVQLIDSPGPALDERK